MRHGLGSPLPYLRLAAGVGAGWLAASIVPLRGDVDLIVRVLSGFVVGAAAFNLPVLWAIRRFDADQTHRWVRDLSPGRRVVDGLVLLAGFASLGAVAMMFIGSDATDDTERVLESALALAAIAMAWISVHTNYTLRYASHYYRDEPHSIDFGDQPPRLSDFAYLAFTLGMTYQVSDTALRTARVRAIVLAHTLISYVFGAVIIAASINLVAGLAK